MTLNRYAYCKQDPVNYTDPSGHWGWPTHKSLTENAIKSTGFWSNNTMKQCILFSVQHADDSAFHYSKTKLNKKTGEYENVQDFTLSEAGKKRAKLKNLKGFCDDSNVTYGKKIKKEMTSRLPTMEGGITIPTCHTCWGLRCSSRKATKSRTLPCAMTIRYTSR